MSAPAYESYKDSGVEWLGEVPSHWEIAPLKRAVEFTTGWTPPTGRDDFYNGDLMWANISDLNGRYLDDTAKKITEAAIIASGMQLSPAGSLLFSFKLSIGQVAFTRQPMFTNEAIATFQASEKVHLPFAYYAFPLFVVANASENIYGAKLLNQDLIKNSTLALPPAAEQTAIAAFLDRETDKIDALIEAQTRLIELLKEKRQAVISHAVTKGLNPNAPMKDSGIEWLGQVPAHWDVKAIKLLTAEGTSITYGMVQAGPEYEGGVPYIRTGDMSGDRLPDHGYPLASPVIEASYERSRVFPGDIVVAIRATIGKALAVPDTLQMANLTQGTAKISPGPKVLRDYLLFYLQAEPAQVYFDLMAKGATFREITLDALRRLPVAVPEVPEQDAIVVNLKSITKHFDKLVRYVASSKALLQERRAALISAAVTGKIDVRGLVNIESEAA